MSVGLGARRPSVGSGPTRSTRRHPSCLRRVLAAAFCTPYCLKRQSRAADAVQWFAIKSAVRSGAESMGEHLIERRT